MAFLISWRDIDFGDTLSKVDWRKRSEKLKFSGEKSDSKLKEILLMGRRCLLWSIARSRAAVQCSGWSENHHNIKCKPSFVFCRYPSVAPGGGADMEAVFADVVHYGQSVSWFIANQTICHVSKRCLLQTVIYNCIFYRFLKCWRSLGKGAGRLLICVLCDTVKHWSHVWLRRGGGWNNIKWEYFLITLSSQSSGNGREGRRESTSSAMGSN